VSNNRLIGPVLIMPLSHLLILLVLFFFFFFTVSTTFAKKGHETITSLVYVMIVAVNSFTGLLKIKISNERSRRHFLMLWRYSNSNRRKTCNSLLNNFCLLCGTLPRTSNIRFLASRFAWSFCTALHIPFLSKGKLLNWFLCYPVLVAEFDLTFISLSSTSF
jgi:hypothetical protein